MSISVVIPTYNAIKHINTLLSRLFEQSYIPDEVFVVDSDSTDGTQEIIREYNNVSLITINKADFDHGGTRHMAFLETKGDYVVFLTQDALPYPDFIEKILEPFIDRRVAVVTGCQVARKDATVREKYTRQAKYPDHDIIRTKADVSKFGIKTFFTTDVCSAYRREAYFLIGGFDNPCRTMEDIIFGARAINSGWSIYYKATAKVLHSHNFTLRQLYNRNFEIGASIAERMDIFKDVGIASEGFKEVQIVAKHLFLKGHWIELLWYCLECFVRFFANRKGKTYVI